MEELQELLASWFETHKRVLPWRTDPIPYHVWLSEIILQQTRVNQGLNYFLRFIGRWPSLPDLAAATEEEVLKMWQGLGYYSRARNLHQCARQVMERHGGEFPADYEQLRQLENRGFENVGQWSFEQARRLIDRIAGNGWRTPRDINPHTYVPPTVIPNEISW